MASLGTSIRQPPWALTGRQPWAVSVWDSAVTYRGRPFSRTMPLRWHRSSGAIAEMNRRLPVRQEAQMGMQRAEAGKEGVHEPELLSGEGHLVRVDLGRDVGRAGDVATVEFARRLDPRRQGGHALQEPDLGTAANRDPVRRRWPAPSPARSGAATRRATLQRPQSRPRTPPGRS